MDRHPLAPLFSPRSVLAFTGPADDPSRATEQGRCLREALTAQRFQGSLQFIDIRTAGTLADLAQARADLAVIGLPPAEVAAALEAAGRIGCSAALVLSSDTEAAQAAELKAIARREGLHLLGPNSLGLQRPMLGLNASVVGPLAQPGGLSLVCQSGALTTAMLDWARGNGVGFSAIVSVGRDTGLDTAEVLDFLATDASTQGIVVYLEGISNARRFMSALRSAASAKPVIALKAGRRPEGRAAAQTHSGAIVGSDDVFEAALRRAGAVRVESFVELFSIAKGLASRYRPRGQRLAIVTNGGGPGVLAADAAQGRGLQLAKLDDLGEAAREPQYRVAIEACAADADVDGVLVLHSPKPGTDAAAVARVVTELRGTTGKALLGCFLGDASVHEGRAVLSAAGVPSFRTPESAVGAFASLASFHQNQQLLQQTPPPLAMQRTPDFEAAQLLIESVIAERRLVLTEMESKALLAAFHIPVTQTLLARSPHEAMMIASQLGFPVALKIDSPDIAHKSDVSGVALNLGSGMAVRDAYAHMMEEVARLQPGARLNGVTVQRMAGTRNGREVHVGLVTDDPFGPVVVFGAGGTMIELIRDREMELPPLNGFLARRLIERSRVASTLGEWRGAAPADLQALEQLLLRVSEMACELPQLREMDINPVIVDAQGAVAVDARIVLHGSAASGGGLRAQPYGHLAIAPYPARFEQVWPLRGGGECLVRPIHPGDAQRLQAFVQALSPESRYFRFVSAMTELPAAMLARFALIDYDREMALVALVKEGEGERIVGVSRYVTNPDQASCEFALVVADDYSGRGLGSRLMESIMAVAREKGLSEIQGLVLARNPGMLRLMKSLGFTVKAFPEDPDFRLVSHAL